MMHRHPHGWIGLGPAAFCVALAGCHGSGFETYEVFFDTESRDFGVSGSETDATRTPIEAGQRGAPTTCPSRPASSCTSQRP